MSPTNKNKTRNKKKQKKKEEEKIQKESKNNEKNVPIGLSTKTRIKCEKKINQNKTKIQKITKLKTKNQKCVLIKESKEIINKFEKKNEKEKDKKKRKLNKEIFDPKMNHQNAIKLKNQNQTAWNPSEKSRGRILGQTKYSTGKHKIKIKIDQFPNINTESNWIYLGVINTENRENLIKNGDYEETYYFRTHWDKNLHQSFQVKKQNGKLYSEKYPENIKLKENDIFEILLDMDQKTIAFKINENNLGIAWENLPASVHFYAYLEYMEGNEKNQITLI
ncbi:spry domain containing socs box protein [Anaeramoeba flamelloides]|uniref:Spry domain containing socs box protein n=1 Tax=Anaeramoeba flamelloides TaxID=1746091 RepID=A0AAV7YMT4_9EUKA|nr:spry domain containing socs box protein [Anaeramoeba flamelloides]